MTDPTSLDREGTTAAALVSSPRGRTAWKVWSYGAAGPSGSGIRRSVTNLVLLAAAALVAATGAIHLHLWADGYRSIPTIGPLFLFQGITTVAVAGALAVFRRLLAVAVAVALMLATVGGLLLSVYVGLFGFMDTFAAPFAGASLAVEAAAVVISLGGGLLLCPQRSSRLG